MQQKTTYRITALTLAIVMFFTSFSYSVDVHYCQGHLKSVKLFGQAKTCHEMAAENSTKACSSSKHNDHHNSKSCADADDEKDCCQNKTFNFESDDDQQILSSTLLDLDQVQFLASFVVQYLLTLDRCTDDNPRYTQYRPPLLFRDIPVLIQSFLL